MVDPAFYMAAGMRLVKKTVNQDHVSADHRRCRRQSDPAVTSSTFFDFPARQRDASISAHWTARRGPVAGLLAVSPEAGPASRPAMSSRSMAA